MKASSIGMVGVLVLVAGLSAQKAPSFSVPNGETFTGKITDNFSLPCKAKSRFAISTGSSANITPAASL
jgi:hypothetical protein